MKKKSSQLLLFGGKKSTKQNKSDLKYDIFPESNTSLFRTLNFSSGVQL